MRPERFKPVPYVPDLPFDWATGGRQLSEQEREIAKRIAQEGKWPTPERYTGAQERSSEN